MFDKSWEQQQREVEAGREAGRRNAASGETSPWSSNPDYTRGLEEGRRDHQDAKAAGDAGGGLVAFLLIAFLFFAKAVWHALSNPAEALIHYGFFHFAKQWIIDVADEHPLIVLIVAVGAPILAIASFRSTLFAVREAEIEIDYRACLIHPWLGWILFYGMIGVTVAAGCWLVSLGTQGRVVPLIVVEVPTQYAYAAVAIVPTFLRLFFHPLAPRYNPILRA